MIKVLNPVGRELKEMFERNEAVCGHVLGLFQLFSNKARFRIICMLVRGEFCVNEIATVVGGKMSNTSQQLKMLTLSGIIERRREEQRILYSLKDKRMRKMIQFLQRQFLNGELK